MRMILIRHGQTAGNLRHAYIGAKTDEPLCELGRQALARMEYPEAAHVFTSPMRRCVETAQMIYPEAEPEIVEAFRECDFGEFEGLSYAELNGRADYQAWIDSGGDLPFPGGESRVEFAARCVEGYERLLSRGLDGDCALVVHGGTIMAIMEACARPERGYFEYQVRNGEGFILNGDGSYERLRRTE